MDRLVKSDVNELNLVFIRGRTCSTTFRLTNLMHTMSVAISLNTSNPLIFSFAQSFAIIPPLGTFSVSLILSKPLDQPPLSTPLDNILVRSTMLPTGKASQEELRRLFSKPGPHIFKDVTIPISFVGVQVIEFLISSKFSKKLEIAFVLSNAILWCDEMEIRRLLRSAFSNGNGYVVSCLIDAGADVNQLETDDESVMMLAVKSGDIETIRVLIESGYMIDHKNDRLLHVAVSTNRVDIMEVLCLNYLDLDLNLKDFKGKTCLHIAASYGYIEVLQFLINLGCDPDLVDFNGLTAIHYATINGHLESVKFLLNSCNYVKYAVNKDGKTAFTLAVENGHTGLYDMLHLGDVLLTSARKGDVDEMKKCLSKGANVNGKDQNGWTALHRVSFKGYIDGVKMLMENGARVDLVDGYGFTALHRAVEAGHADVAMTLIGYGAKANMKSIDLDCFKKFDGFSAPFRHKIERV